MQGISDTKAWNLQIEEAVEAQKYSQRFALLMLVLR